MQTYGGYPLASEALAGQRADIIFMAFTRVSAGNWSLRIKTSSDFITWTTSVDTGVTFASSLGIDATNELRNPFLMQLESGEVWIFFEVVEATLNNQELINIYYTTSGNYGTSWTEAVKLTNYTSYTVIAQNPTATQKTRDTMHVFYNEFRNALTMDANASGYCGDVADPFAPGDIYYDSTADKAYAVVGNIGNAGQKTFEGIVEIDLDTWAITDCWSTASSPAFEAWYQNNHSTPERFYGERPYMVIGSTSLTGGDSLDHHHIGVLNYVDNTITNYHFMDNASAGVTKNVNWTDYAFHEIFQNYTPIGLWIDAVNNRLYCGFTWGTTTGYVHIGYLDLTETGPTYNFTDVVVDWGFSQNERLNLETASGGFQVYPDQDYIVITVADAGTFNDNPMKIYRISDGGEVKNYRRSTNTGFPNFGIRRGFLLTNVNGEDVIYGGFSYTTSFSQTTIRGLIKITLSTDTIKSIRPTTSSIDDYFIKGVTRMDDNTLAMTSNTGIYTMDVNSEVWNIINNANTPGLTEDGNDYWTQAITYDPTRGLILAGALTVNGWQGLVGVSQYGPLKKSNYILGTKSGTWSFGVKSPTVQGINDYDLVAAVDPDTNGLHVFWTNDSLTELSIKKDSELGTININKYLSREHEIIMERHIDGTPSKLKFTITHGHLFDRWNKNSLLSSVMQKSRKISLRFGEKSGGIEYWKNQGTFIITENAMSGYKRGSYPFMVIQCEDKLSTWNDHEVIATNNFSGADPENVLSDLVKDNTDFGTEDLNIPSMNNKEDIYYQWLETPLIDILTQIANRYGYYIRIDMDGKFNLKEISTSNSSAQSYSDASHIISFSPDDTFSDFTNQVVVSGEEIDFIEVVHAEERVTDITGTVGWWGGKETYTIYYSEDKQRTMRNPRMVVLATVKTIGFKIAEVYGGKINEGIDSTDPNEHWTKTFIDVPNLAPALLVALGIAAAGVTKGNINIHPGGTSPAVTKSIPIGRIVFGAGVTTALKILGSVVNFKHEIWAQPIGKVRRSVQATADDTELQASIGDTITKKFDDPLCNTVTGCQFVADFELLIAKLQRKRVKFTKVTNLIEEDGDIIEIKHPHTNQTIKIFIALLTRKFKIGSTDGGGYFLDDIEGWVVE